MLEFNESLIAFDLQVKEAKEVIDLLADSMHAQGLVAADYGAQTWAREIDHPTGLPVHVRAGTDPRTGAAGAAFARKRETSPAIL